MRKIDHFVVIYQENHSFDNLYGGWEKVDGLRDADAAHTAPGRPGRRAVSVPQADGREPHFAAADGDLHGHDDGTAFTSHFPNAPFQIDDYIAPERQDVPGTGRVRPQWRAQGLTRRCPGGCTRDLVHRFYQEQYQLNGGRQNRYVTGSDAVGLTMGYYDTASCRSTSTCTSRGHRTT